MLNLSQWVPVSPWFMEGLLVLGLTALVHLAEVAFVKRFMKRHFKTEDLWEETFVLSLHRPLGVWIWLMGFCFVFRFMELAGLIRALGSIALFLWGILRFISRVEHAFAVKARKTGGASTTPVTLSRLTRVLVMIAGALMIFQTLGYPISGLLAIGGAGTLVAGFAAKDVLANFFGGLMIYLDRPFIVGDWIRSADKGVDGYVEHIGWRLTQIRTFDKRPLYVPNALFSNMVIENPSRMTHRRIKETVGIRYEDAKVLSPLLQDIRGFLKNHPDLDKNCLCTAYFYRFGENALECMIEAHTFATQAELYGLAQEKVLLGILKLIEQHGAQVAAPIMTVHVPELQGS
jgi:MscS family membrane protein